MTPIPILAIMMGISGSCKNTFCKSGLIVEFYSTI